MVEFLEIGGAAFRFIRDASAKEYAMFLKGHGARATKLFMDDHGQFCGDRGWTKFTGVLSIALA